MKFKQLCIISALLCVLSLSGLSLVSGATFGNTASSGDGDATASANQYNGYLFQMGPIDGLLKNFSIYTRVAGATFEMALYSDDAGSPGDYLGDSVSGVSVLNGWVTVNASLFGAWNYPLEADTWYWITTCNPASLATIYTNVTDTQAYYTGNYGTRWIDPFNEAGLFYLQAHVYVSYEEEAAPTPTPSPTPTPAPTSEGWDLIGSLVVPVLMPLVVIGITALLCSVYAGSWGFVAGLNLGVILCLNAGLVDLWVVVVVVCIDGFLFYGAIQESYGKRQGVE